MVSSAVEEDEDVSEELGFSVLGTGMLRSVVGTGTVRSVACGSENGRVSDVEKREEGINVEGGRNRRPTLPL